MCLYDAAIAINDLGTSCHVCRNNPAGKNEFATPNNQSDVMGNHLFNNMMRHTIEHMCIHTRFCSLHFILFGWLLCVYVYTFIYYIYTNGNRLLWLLLSRRELAETSCGRHSLSLGNAVLRMCFVQALNATNATRPTQHGGTS